MNRNADGGRIRPGRWGWLRGAGFLTGLALLAVPAGFAVWFQFAGAARIPGLAIVTAAALTALLLRWRRHPRAAWAVLALLLVTGAAWWSTIRPAADRDWAPDVAHGVTAEVNGDQVVLHNVRAFDWQSAEAHIPHWETRQYDLRQLVSADLVTSVWASPAIAHTLISFGFTDGRHVTFSAEIRRERGEAFSELGGFFRQFELVLIAADERDIIYLRTNMRREDVALYPLHVSPEQARALFLRYLDLGNALDREPAFYHTILANCTTIIFHLARQVVPDLPPDWRILLSGYLPDYLHELGILAPGLSVAEARQRARISALAQDGPADRPYSELIRQNQAGL